MRQLHDMGTTITHMLNRDFVPGRMAYPALAGRQKPEVSGFCHKVSYQFWINQGLLDAKHLRSSLTYPELIQKLSREITASTVSNELRG